MRNRETTIGGRAPEASSLPPGLAARYEAQKIAFGPVVFQIARSLIKFGVLEALEAYEDDGASVDAIIEKAGVSRYAAKLLLEGGLSIGAVSIKEERYFPTMLGFMLLHDELTRVNIDFIHDVCYLGLFDLEEALKTGEPAGLKRLISGYSTIYEALQHLPQQVKDSWFAFDHFYSDHSFADIAPIVLAADPERLMDIGANTGKFSTFVLGASPKLAVTMVDLPDTLKVGLSNVAQAGFAARVSGQQANMLDPDQQLPKGQDVVWMSQFLCCFSEQEVVTILKNAASALSSNGRIFIADTFWDHQPYDIAKYCIINTSPYFTALANGNSKMYSLADMTAMVEKAGLKIASTHGPFGYGNSLLEIKDQ